MPHIPDISSFDSPPSFWSASARIPHTPYAPLAGECTVDVAIVGGGFTGLSTALHLAEMGREVCVLEAGDIGFGASGRNGGQVLPGLKLGENELVARFGEPGRRFFALAEEAPDFLVDLLARKSLSCRFIRTGALRLPHSAVAEKRVATAARELQRRGVDAQWLDARQVRDVIGSEKYSCALLDPRAGSIHPLEFVRELARVTHESGATIHARSPAIRLERKAHGWTVHGAHGRVHAKTVVIATNGYSDDLVPELARSLLPVNSFQIATAPLDAGLQRTLLRGEPCAFETRRMAIYFRKSFDGRLLFGGRASFSSRRNDAPTADYSVMEREMHARFTQLKDVPIEFRWTGLVCITPDFLPHFHEPQTGLKILLGFNGRGVALSVRAGAWLARHISDVEDTGSMPPSAITPIPFHSMRAPLLNAAMRYYRLLDAIGI